jgi:hypothetical protein
MESDLSLVGFCRLALNADNRRLVGDAAYLGRLFRQYVRIERTPSLLRTVEIVRSLGIVIEEVDYLSSYRPGTNMMSKEGIWYIHYYSKDRPGTQKFTIFHELFEIIQKCFAELVPSKHIYQGTETNQSAKRYNEQSADRFAGAVLLSQRSLLKHLTDTGCDLVKLAEGLELSQQCLLIAMEQHLAKIPFVGALYEYQPQDAIRSRLRAYDYIPTLVVKTGPALKIQEICQRQPKLIQNKRPCSGSLVCAALQGGFPIFYHNSEQKDSMAVLVRPLFSGARAPSRSIFLSLPEAKSHRFFPQVDQIQAVVVNENSPCPSAYKCRNSEFCRWKQ